MARWKPPQREQVDFNKIVPAATEMAPYGRRAPLRLLCDAEAYKCV